MEYKFKVGEVVISSKNNPFLILERGFYHIGHLVYLTDGYKVKNLKSKNVYLVPKGKAHRRWKLTDWHTKPSWKVLFGERK